MVKAKRRLAQEDSNRTGFLMNLLCFLGSKTLQWIGWTFAIDRLLQWRPVRPLADSSCHAGSRTSPQGGGEGMTPDSPAYVGVRMRRTRDVQTWNRFNSAHCKLAQSIRALCQIDSVISAAPIYICSRPAPSVRSLNVQQMTRQVSDASTLERDHSVIVVLGYLSGRARVGCLAEIHGFKILEEGQHFRIHFYMWQFRRSNAPAANLTVSQIPSFTHTHTLTQVASAPNG